MKKITYLLVNLLFAAILLSCSQEDSIVNGDLDDQNRKSDLKVSESELISNVTEFLDDFYSDNLNTKGSAFSKGKPKIKGISLLTKDDLPQAVQTKSSAEGIEIDSMLYFVNLDEGFVIAGADKRTMPIFAIIDSGSFSKEILKSDDDNDRGILEYIERTLCVVNEDIKDNELYNTGSAVTKAYTIKERIYPRLGLTKWHQQGSPYDLYCPGRMPAGCVIATVAQVASYYQSPKSVYYGSNIPENPTGQPFTLNLNWTNIMSVSNGNSGVMPYASYNFTSGNYSASQAVGLYMRYLGVMLGAVYAYDGTGATNDYAREYMKNYIGLQVSNPKSFDRTNLYNHIRGGNIVVLTGYANASGGIFNKKYTDGHMWLSDGVFVCCHTHQYFHYNWGWGGRYNGYFFEDRWNPSQGEFNDTGNLKPQENDYYKNYKYNLKCILVSR